MNLDDLQAFEKIDSSDMLGYINALPDQLAGAWAAAQQSELPTSLADVERVVICGMGGSAISGDLLAALVRGTCRIPVSVSREYGLPAFVQGEETLVIAMSHSGGTEETISAAELAVERGTHLMAITTGGELARVVREGDGMVLAYTYPSQPRAALGWLYGLLIGAFSRLGLVGDLGGEVQEAIDLLKRGREALGAQQPAALNPAKRTAGQLVGRLPVIWGAGLLAPVARRWQTQINEQAKALAYSDALPELDHNTVAALGFPEPLLRQLAVIDLVSLQHDHPRVAIRHEATRGLLLRAGVMVDLISARGQSRLAQQMGMIQLGDYVSYYLAMAYGVDPTPIESIQQLKDILAQAV